MAAPLALSAFTASVESDDQWIDLAWTYNAGGQAATRCQFNLYYVISGVPTLLAGPWTVERPVATTFRLAAQAGLTYRITAQPLTDVGGPVSTSSDLTVFGDPTGATVNLAVTVDGSLGPVTQCASGLLYGVGNNVTNNLEWLTPLNIKQWRFFYDPTGQAAIEALGTSTTMVMSDSWFNTQHTGGYTIGPWADWTNFENVYAGLVNAAIAEDRVPDYFDIWNEFPIGFGLGWNPADSANLTVANFLELCKRAYNVIKGIDPTFKIVAPSLSFPNWVSHPGPPVTYPSLDEFLAYSDAEGLTWDALSWHENDTRNDGDPQDLVVNIERHITDMKTILANYPGTVTGDRIHIAEYGAQSFYLYPGACVTYMRIFEDEQIAQANRAIWAGQDSNQLSGLLYLGDPIPAYWTYHAYAQMAGKQRMRVTSDASFQVGGLATADPSTQTVQLLLGRHWIPGFTTPGVVTVTVDWPYGDVPVRATARTFGAGAGTLVEPIQTLYTSTVTDGTYTITLPAFEDGSAMAIDIAVYVPAEIPPAAPTVHIFQPPILDNSPRASVDMSRADQHFWNHFRRPPTGVNVYKLIDGTYTQVQPGRPEDVAIWYFGGHIYEVDDAEAASLIAAGYTVTGVVVDIDDDITTWAELVGTSWGDLVGSTWGNL